MEEYTNNFEDVFLAEAVETGKPVKLFHTTGYQQTVTVLDYNCDALMVLRSDGARALVYRHGLSTIVMVQEG